MAKFKKPADIRVGVIGYGGAFNMGRAHLNEMKQAGMTPVAVVEIDKARLKIAEQEFPGIETYTSVDAMLRGLELYHGASTGRWTGVRVQPHNFPKGKIKDMERVWEDIKQAYRERSLELLEMLYGDVMELLSHAVRGALCSPDGMVLTVADYAAIEARVVLWLAGEHEALEILRAGGDIYCDLASAVYGRKVTKADKDERQLGKQGILGCGFGMGWKRFQETCAKYGIIVDDATAQMVVTVYRERYPRVKQMWYAQEAAAIQAVTQGGTVTCGKIQWRVVGRFLYARLPSGRRLAYCDPVVVDATTPWGTAAKKLTFMAVDSYTRQWMRQGTYGGSLVENLVQAIARDIMAEAKLRIEAHPAFTLVLSVHDELIGYAATPANDNRQAALCRQFEDLVAGANDNIAWLEGCPVAAEGWVGRRYRK